MAAAVVARHPSPSSYLSRHPSQIVNRPISASTSTPQPPTSTRSRRPVRPPSFLALVSIPHFTRCRRRSPPISILLPQQASLSDRQQADFRLDLHSPATDLHPFSASDTSTFFSCPSFHSSLYSLPSSLSTHLHPPTSAGIPLRSSTGRFPPRPPLPGHRPPPVLGVRYVHLPFLP